MRALLAGADPAGPAVLDQASRDRLAGIQRAVTAAPRPARRPLLAERLAPPRGRPPLRARGLAVAAVSAAAATAAAVTLAGGTTAPGGSTGGAVITLAADYQLRLPAGFTLDNRPDACRALVFEGSVRTTRRGPGGLPEVVWPPVQVPAFAGAMRSASSASGGCINVLLTGAYQIRAGHPDPEVYPGERAVRVGRYHGWIRSYWLTSGRGAPRRLRERVTQLNVQLPVGRTLMSDLLVGSSRLTADQLVRIVARGLASR